MTEPDEWRVFEAVAITTHPVPAYGGFRAGVELLQQAADQFNSGPIAMHAQHDLTDQIHTRNVSAAVRKRPDGFYELVLNGEVHRADSDRVRELTGMSVTLFTPLGDGLPKAEITLAADAGWFDDEDIAAAGSMVTTVASVSTARAYQFALQPDPQIFVELSLMTLQSLGPNLAASALWDGLKHLLLRRKVPPGANELTPTVINVSVNEIGGWTAAVETNDPDVAVRALESLTDAALRAQAAYIDAADCPPVRWDEGTGEWGAVASKREPHGALNHSADPPGVAGA